MSTQPVSFDAPLKQATSVNVLAGVTFDAPTSAATTVPLPSQIQDPQPAPSTAPKVPMATISATPQPDGIAARAERWAGNVAYDLEHGTNLTGVGSVLKAMGAHGLDYGNSQGVADYMGSLPLGLLKAAKGESELAQSGKRWKGAKDIAGGALQAATIPGSFVAPEAGEIAPEVLDRAASAAGKAGTAVAETAGKTANAVRRPFSLKAVQESLQNSKDSIQQSLANHLQNIQDTWHGSLRDLFDDVAQEAGVKPQPAESLHDVAANTAAAVKAKASAIYKQLDQAIGGTRFQTFDEQLNNVRRALRNSAGIDPDADGRLVERINQLEDAKAAALEQAKANGVDPNLIHRANATHRQAMALEDLSKHIQASMSGLRANLANGVNAAQESLSPAKLASRANRLYNTGRLQQALGDDHADDILTVIETSRQRAKDAAENAVRQTEQAVANAEQKAAAVKTRRLIGGAVAASAGAPTAWEWLKHLLGE